MQDGEDSAAACPAGPESAVSSSSPIGKTAPAAALPDKALPVTALLDKTLFPFSRIRDEQKRMLEDAYSVVSSGGSLLAHAPTGIGKTAASLPPAVAYALEAGKTVFFLTPKHSQHRIAVETLKKMNAAHGKRIVAIDMIGKQWTCPYESARDLSSSEFNHFCRAHKRNETCRFCNRVYEPGAKELTPAARAAIEAIKKGSPLHAEEAVGICGASELCPYEISVIAARSANVIIGDYYHIFHPHVRQMLLSKMDKALEDVILIVDEAHNLPDRVRKLMSSTLSEYTVSHALKEAHSLREGGIEESLDSIAHALDRLSKGMRAGGDMRRNEFVSAKELARGGEMFVKKEQFIAAVEGETGIKLDLLVEDLDKFGDIVLELPNRYRSFASSVSEFLAGWAEDRDETAYARILNTYQSQSGKRYELSMDCLDPALFSGEVFSRAHASILMSGTLLPTEMYATVLGLGEARAEQYHNPFPPENRLVLMTHGITTKFTQRSDHMWGKIAATLSRVINEVPGNVAAFFPSYNMLDRISTMARVRKELLLERQEMSKSERHALYKRLAELSKPEGGADSPSPDISHGGANNIHPPFTTANNIHPPFTTANNMRPSSGGALFAVQAGSFSEGMDFPGRMLDCAIVVGLPLEKPTLETEALIRYYDSKFGRGWDYGYIYPAMNRALQAAGRCIRSETDRGVIVLMDDRFQWQNYKKCFPKDMKFVLTEVPEEHVAGFFSLKPHNQKNAQRADV